MNLIRNDSPYVWFEGSNFHQDMVRLLVEHSSAVSAGLLDG